VRMLKVFVGLALVLALALAASGCCPGCYVLDKAWKLVSGKPAPCHAPGTAEATKAQTTCPVMGGKINKSLYVDYQGKRIYVCCPDCLPKVRQDPAKYVEKLEDAGVVLEKVPAAQQ